MFSFLPKPLIGIINLLFHTINLLLCSILIYIIAFFKIFSWGNLGIKIFDKLGSWAAIIFTFNNLWFMWLTTRMRYDVRGGENLSHKEWYLLMSNHQSWADILLLERVFAFRIPMLKFFLKKELIWVPLVGTSCWALNFPFMKRYTREFVEKNPNLKGQDLITTRKACERFKHIPATMLNFIEGTRFTIEKHQKQQSDYKHLLKPKAGGVAFVLDAMGDTLTSILDVTVVYPESKHLAWDYFCGRLNHIIIDIQILPIRQSLIGNYQEDSVFKEHFQIWLNQRWQQKDEKITALKAELND